MEKEPNQDKQRMIKKNLPARGKKFLSKKIRVKPKQSQKKNPKKEWQLVFVNIKIEWCMIVWDTKMEWNLIPDFFYLIFISYCRRKNLAYGRPLDLSHPLLKQTDRPSAWHGYGLFDTLKFFRKISICWNFEPNWLGPFCTQIPNYCYYSITSNLF